MPNFDKNTALTGTALDTFEKALTTNAELADVVALYQDIPDKLKQVQTDLAFNAALKREAQYHYQQRKRQQRKRWGLVALFAVVLSLLIWWAFFRTHANVEEVPIASLKIDFDQILERRIGQAINRGNDTLLVDKWYEKAYFSYQSNNYEQTLIYLDSIPTTRTVASKKLLLMGRCQYELHNYEAAIQTYQQYLDLGNDRDLVLWLQVFAYQDNGDTEGVERNLREITQEKYTHYKTATHLLKTLF